MFFEVIHIPKKKHLRAAKRDDQEKKLDRKSRLKTQMDFIGWSIEVLNLRHHFDVMDDGAEEKKVK